MGVFLRTSFLQPEFGPINGHADADLLKSLQPLFSRLIPDGGAAVAGTAGGRGSDGDRLSWLFRDSEIPAHPRPPEDYFDFLETVLLPHLANVSSPRCAGHMSGATPDFHERLAGFVVRTNQNLVKFEASRALSLLERQTLAMLHRLVYEQPGEFYDLHVQEKQSTLGIACSGGGMANLAGLWCARNLAFPPRGSFVGVEQAGLASALVHYGCERAVILTSRAAHYSIEKAAAVLGLGSDGVLPLATDECGGLDPESLGQQLEECRRQNWKVVAVVGVAGSTETGSIDPLEAIAAVTRPRGIHFHVDAAWGAPFLFSEEVRPRLRGIGEADSVTVDGHKLLYTPVGVSALLLRDPTAAGVLEKTARYMLRPNSEDLGKRSLEGSRSGSVLFVHAALRTFGRAGFGRMLDHALSNARLFAELVRQRPEFELLLKPETNIVLYRYVPQPLRGTAAGLSLEQHEAVNLANEALQAEQFRGGRTYVSRTRLEGFGPFRARPTVALRAVIAHPLTAPEDLHAILDDQATIGARLTGLVPENPRPLSMPALTKPCT